MSDATRRMVRTFLQMVAAGGLTALVNQIASDIPAAYTPYILIGFTLLTSFAQNWLEDNVEGMPAVLKGKASPGLNPTTNDPVT